MEAKEYLQDYAQKANRFLDLFFAKERKEAAKISPICGQMIDVYREFMRGGKMVRGALTYLGYKCGGGSSEEVATWVSAAIEIFASFLLIHDDWIDGDVSRRGSPTAHLQFQKIFKKRKWRGNEKHWGASMAIVLGDAGCVLAYRILSKLRVTAGCKTRAIAYLSDCLAKTAYGEVLDLTYDLQKKVSYQDLLRARELKTGYYTLAMPLVTGAILAGASRRKVEAIEGYALPVGIAFQLRDDELGLFGSGRTLGKSNLTDLLEGKKTLLILKAIENLKGKEKKFLFSAWGKGKVNQEKIKKAKGLIERSGALAHSQKMARKLVEKGKKFVPQITSDPELQDTLYKMADFMIERES